MGSMGWLGATGQSRSQECSQRPPVPLTPRSLKPGLTITPSHPGSALGVTHREQVFQLWSGPPLRPALPTTSLNPREGFRAGHSQQDHSQIPVLSEVGNDEHVEGTCCGTAREAAAWESHKANGGACLGCWLATFHGLHADTFLPPR